MRRTTAPAFWPSATLMVSISDISEFSTPLQNEVDNGGFAPPFSPSTSTSTWKIIRAKSDQMVFIRSEKSSNASFL